jgi:hypothetical protein
MEIHLIFQIQNIYNIQKLMKNNNDRKITVPSQLKQKKENLLSENQFLKKQWDTRFNNQLKRIEAV